MVKFQYTFLGLILFFGFLARLYRFDAPIADWHSWRQADTSAVSKIFAQKGFDILYPRYYDVSNIQSGVDNPQGYRFVEFPLYNIFQAGGYVLFDIFTIEQWGRLVSIISSTLSGLFIFLLVRKYLSLTAALFSAFFYAFLPFSIYYGRTVLPDNMLVMASLGGIYFFDKWLEEKSKSKEQRAKIQIKYQIFYVFSLLFIASSLLLKPFAVFFTLPMIYLAYKAYGFSIFRQVQLWMFAVLSITPLILWRWWIGHYPEGIPGFWWLLNGDGIRFKGSYFYWLYGERLSKLILGYTGIALLTFGFLKREHEKYYLFFLSFLASALFYMVVIAKGNVQHDYYQILILPFLAIFLGRGAEILIFQTDYTNKIVGRAILLLTTISMFGLSWFHVRTNFNLNYSIVHAGVAAQTVIPKDSKVIAPVEGDTTLLYNVGRFGWPAFQKPIEELIEMGAEYLILLNPVERDFTGFGSQYEIVGQSNDYLIFKLR